MFTDLDEPALRAYRSALTRPVDFDEFWERTVQEARAAAVAPIVERVDCGLTTIDVFDVTFSGFAGQPVKAWLRVPAGAHGPLAAVVQFVGYGGGRGHAVDNLFWASAGFAHLQMDTRGQGSTWSTGDTSDDAVSGPAAPGFLTRGIDAPETLYYRRLMTDAVRAVDTARAHPTIDGIRVSVLGFSQGGGLALAAAALVPELHHAFAFVPFLCDIPRAVTITDNDPYREVGRYLAVHRDRAEGALRTLSYIDGVNFARGSHVPISFSAAMMDPTCPPSTVFGAYDAYAGRKDIRLWRYNSHEGGGIEDELAALAVLRRSAPA
ncbi:acetylxylan esterase [Leifsonia poae]|uniref:acetylxylan esterase n=1 Tax=Leifsonia poae TaxID=110933 RepID=UPI001CBDDC05|nr:acetylxylan esterase [Leifsonia poae]